MADARSASGKSLSGLTVRGEVSATGSWDAATTVTLKFAHAICQIICGRRNGSLHPMVRRSGFFDVVCCHFETAFDLWAERDANHVGPRRVPVTIMRSAALQPPVAAYDRRTNGAPAQFIRYPEPFPSLV